MYATTGFTREEIVDLCALVLQDEEGCGIAPWPPSLGLFRCMVIALTYMRRNRVQEELAETYGTSQPTVSRAVARIVARLVKVLAPYVPTADDLDPTKQYIFDGTLLPCWSWRGHRELWSGKHKATGKNVQVACDLYGNLAWVSDAIDGHHHDAFCIEESLALTGLEAASLGDKGYIGKGMVTPIKKTPGRELLDWEKDFNKVVNGLRAVVEQVIGNFKTWRIMHTDYRRPLATFDETISAVVGLHFYRLS